MIRKLRLKFVAIIMTVVLLMLSVIFGLVYHFTRVNLEKDSLRMMRGIAATTVLERRPNDIAGEVRLPFFVVRLDSLGQIIAAEGGYYDLSDQQFIRDMVSQVLASGSHAGRIPDYNLRYCRINAPGSQILVFADTSSEQATLNSLIRTCLLTGLISGLAFLGISIYLSKWAVSPIANAWKQQKQFVADASHELKTPLTVITTNAELLQQPGNSEENCRTFSGSILTTAQQMRRLLEQMLELARSDRETLSSPGGDVDLSRLACDAAMTYESVLFEQGLTMDYAIDDGIHICGIEPQLQHLLAILLDNAGKYAARYGAVTLTLRRQGKKHCLLSVANQGPPLSEEDCRNIFKRFYRADPARSQTGSYGLGLAIAENITHQHRGRIWAESRGGVNTFFAEFPIQ